MADGGPQQIVGGGYTQRSLSAPKLPLASRPSPPKSQRLPLLSVQLVASSRPPGMFVLAGDCSVPYTPDRKGVPLPAHPHPLARGGIERPKIGLYFCLQKAVGFCTLRAANKNEPR